MEQVHGSHNSLGAIMANCENAPGARRGVVHRAELISSRRTQRARLKPITALRAVTTPLRVDLLLANKEGGLPDLKCYIKCFIVKKVDRAASNSVT